VPGWFYGSEADRKGPVDIEQLKQLARSGRLPPHALVWTEGMAGWVPLGSIVHVPHAQASEAGLGLLIPTGPQSALAIIAGYLGLASFLVVPAPFAILLGILALRDIKIHPEKAGKGRAITGIVLGAIVMVFFGLILVASKK
jgi:hypothetical protein